MGGQQGRPVRRGRTHLALRLAGGGLLIAAGEIHLDLYLAGYRSIPVIGWFRASTGVARTADPGTGPGPAGRDAPPETRR